MGGWTCAFDTTGAPAVIETALGALRPGDGWSSRG